MPVTGIAEATFARSLSGHAEQRAAAGAAFADGPSGRPAGDADARTRSSSDVRTGAVRVEGRRVRAGLRPDPRPAATEYGWDIDLGAMATIWRGGCIIRAAFLDRIREAYDAEPGPADAAGRRVLRRGGQARPRVGWRRVVATRRAPASRPRRSPSSLAYYDGLRGERLPAALIQGLRDYFGAHTYRRVDREGAFHTLWGGDRSEEKQG